jgi:hypothetical protein
MVEVLCLWHRGIRCALPSRQVLGAEPASAGPVRDGLWEALPEAAADAERSLNVQSALGPTWISGTGATILSLTKTQLHELSPLLRELVRLPHVVGLADLDGELVWLVDARRFRPPGSASFESGAGSGTSKVGSDSRLFHD